MTVEELINALQQFDPKLRVIMRGYEGGYNDANYAELQKVALDVHTAWYLGKHEDTDASLIKDRLDQYITENGVLIDCRRTY